MNAWNALPSLLISELNRQSYTTLPGTSSACCDSFLRLVELSLEFNMMIDY